MKPAASRTKFGKKCACFNCEWCGPSLLASMETDTCLRLDATRPSSGPCKRQMLKHSSLEHQRREEIIKGKRPLASLSPLATSHRIEHTSLSCSISRIATQAIQTAKSKCISSYQRASTLASHTVTQPHRTDRTKRTIACDHLRLLSTSASSSSSPSPLLGSVPVLITLATICVLHLVTFVATSSLSTSSPLTPLHPYQQSSSALSAKMSSQVAIVRRLYPSSSSSSSTLTSSRSSRGSVISPSSSPHPATTPLLPHSARGIAKVTPITLQPYVRLGQVVGPRPPSPTMSLAKLAPATPSSATNDSTRLISAVQVGKPTESSPLPVSIVSAVIPLVSSGVSLPASDEPLPSLELSPTTSVSSSSSNIALSPPHLVSPSVFQVSSRQGKSLSSVASLQSSTSSTPSTTSAQPQQEESNLCFLSHGGSSETFTVNEAMPIDSIIGTIKVIGNASLVGGNIELSIMTPSDSGGTLFKSSSSTFTSYQATTETQSISRRSDSSSNSTEEQSEEASIAIKIEPGTKKLVLARKLDKESAEGELGLTIGVRCRAKKRSKAASKIFDSTTNEVDRSNSANGADSSYWIYDRTPSQANGSQASSEEWNLNESDDNDDIIIPIRILVTDANDNRPEWQGSTPYQVNISEMTTVGSVVLSGIRALDNDQLGPYSTVEYYVQSGPYSHLLRFASPLEGSLVLASPLDYETLANFSVTIRAQDQGQPANTATTLVEVRVLDADDQNPRFDADKYTAVLADGQRAGEALSIQPRRIKADDPDRGIDSRIIYRLAHSTSHNDDDDQSFRDDNSYFQIDRDSGQVSLRRPLPDTVSLPLTLVIRATQIDNADRYALTTLTVLSRRNQVMPELRFLHTNYSSSLLESTPPGHVVLTVQTSRPASPSSALRFQLLDDDEGYFAVRATGEVAVRKALDYEKHKSYSFRVMVTDGRQSDVSRVTLAILNVNEHDPVFGQASYLMHVSEARLRSSPVIGRIEATDGDDGDRVHITLSGPHAGAFALSAQDGTLRLRSLRLLNSTECHLIATATDSGTPPRSSSTSVVVKFAPTLLKSFNLARTLGSGPKNGGASSSFFADWPELEDSAELDRSSSNSAADILQHGAHSLLNASANSTALVLVIVLGVLLGTLFIIIVALTLHVLKSRKYEQGSGGGGRASSPATTALHHPVTGSMIDSSAASTTSSSSSSSSSSNLSINSTRDEPQHYQHHHHLHHHRAHLHSTTTSPSTQSPSPTAAAATLVSTQKKTPGSGLLFHALRLNANKVSPSELSISSPDHLIDRYEQVDQPHQHQHQHQHSHHHYDAGDIEVSRKTFMDTIEVDEVVGKVRPHSATNELDSAISSDLSTNSDNGGSVTSPSDRPKPANLCSQSSRTSLTDLLKNASPIGVCATNSANGTLGSRISVVKWPQGSIPRRVKKLTWQDEQRNNHFDQMYTCNQTVSANATRGVKTLSGHLLTGLVTPSSGQSGCSHRIAPVVAPKPFVSGKSFGQFMPREEETATSTVPNYQVDAQHGPKHQGSSTVHNAGHLPDLTVYF